MTAFTLPDSGPPSQAVRITRIRWSDIEALKAADEGTHDGLVTASEVVLTASNMIAPLDTGNLIGTGVVDWEHETETAHVYYDTVYAAKLHQNPGYNFQNGRRGRYLQSAMNGAKSRVHEMFGESMRVRFSRRRGLP